MKFDFEKTVKEVCNDIAEFLIEKNKSYGNSALEPVHCFYKGDAETAIHIRMDDKISRLIRGKEYGAEDTKKDLCGYLILLEVLKRKQQLENKQ